MYCEYMCNIKDLISSDYNQEKRFRNVLLIININNY